jgi:hypothetical protein
MYRGSRRGRREILPLRARRTNGYYQARISASHAQYSYPQGPSLKAPVWPRLPCKPLRITSAGRALRHWRSKRERSVPPLARGKTRGCLSPNGTVGEQSQGRVLPADRSGPVSTSPPGTPNAAAVAKVLGGTHPPAPEEMGSSPPALWRRTLVSSALILVPGKRRVALPLRRQNR